MYSIYLHFNAKGSFYVADQVELLKLNFDRKKN